MRPELHCLQDPRLFRVTTQSPILRLRALVSRITQADGTFVERTINDQFVMARSVAIQVSLLEDIENNRRETRNVATQTTLVTRDAQTDM